MLKIKELKAKVEGGEILRGIDFEISKGEIHVLMGPNGSGKSSLAHVLMGDPSYEVTRGEVNYRDQDLLKMSIDERARAGVFLAFQNPPAIPGVSVFHMLRKSYELVKKDRIPVVEFMRKIEGILEEVGLDKSFAKRYVNEGFSGGERKRLELAQMILLEPKLVILDEIDSGLDIDSMKIVGREVNKLVKKGSSFLVITHYGRITEYIPVDKVHVVRKGKVVKSGDEDLIKKIEEEGYSEEDSR